MEQIGLSGTASVEDRHEPPAAAEAPRRQAFVEPEVLFPVDVLEATTFFQLTDSGGTT